MVASHQEQLKFCSFCATYVSKSEYSSGRCTDCRNSLRRSRYAIEKRKKKNREKAAAWRRFDAERILRSDEVVDASKALLKAFGGFDGLTCEASRLLNLSDSEGLLAKYRLVSAMLNLFRELDRRQENIKNQGRG